jgi:sirohydrochlorin cobaltochelatase
MTLAQRLATAISDGVNQIGQVAILTSHPEAPYALCHLDDQETLAELTVDRNPFAAQEIAKLAEDGHFRFTKGELSLKRGWLLLLKDADDLRLALDFLYPASVGLWLANQDGNLRVQNLRPKLNRQTGMYRFAHTVSNKGAQKLVQTVCGPGNCCVKKILWQIDDETPLADSEASRWPGYLPDSDPTKVIPLYCQEACNHFVSQTRKAAKAEADAK